MAGPTIPTATFTTPPAFPPRHFAPTPRRCVEYPVWRGGQQLRSRRDFVVPAEYQAASLCAQPPRCANQLLALARESAILFFLFDGHTNRRERLAVAPDISKRSEDVRHGGVGAANIGDLRGQTACDGRVPRPEGNGFTVGSMTIAFLS